MSEPIAQHSEKPRALYDNGIRASLSKVNTPDVNTPSSASSKSQKAILPQVTKLAGADPSAIPVAVTQQFVQLGRKYYFPDGARAFTDHGDRLTTPSENIEVVRSLLDIAQARGWKQVTVSGTEHFRKEAWMAAKLLGLGVKGHRPTKFERAQLVRAAVAASLQRPSPGSDAPGRQHAASTAGSFGDTARKYSFTQARQTYAEQRKGLLTGVLIDHGRAPYRHQPQAQMSYFVTLQTQRGTRTMWGVDLERAIYKSLTQPKQGAVVGMRAVRREPVTVKARQRDAEGRVVSEQSKTVQRNHWIVEKEEFFPNANKRQQWYGMPVGTRAKL